MTMDPAHPTAPHDPAAAKAYWDAHLDPRNLEAEADAASGLTLDDELFFARTPDLLEAADWLKGAHPSVPPPGDWTVDLGAGLGANTLALGGLGLRMLAVDSSPQRLRALQRRAAAAGCPVALVVAAAEHLPFADGSLPRLYTKSVLIHTALAQAADELGRVLTPGGRLALTEPQPGNPFAALYRRWFAPAAWRGITRYFDAATHQTVREALALRRTHCWIQSFYLVSFGAFIFHYAFPCRPLFRFCLSALDGLDSRLFRWFPALKSKAWFGLIEGEKPDRLPRD